MTWHSNISTIKLGSSPWRGAKTYSQATMPISYVNSLSSAMMAYMVGGSEMHLRAAKNAFRMLREQSFATGGWGPDEKLRAPGSGDVFASLAIPMPASKRHAAATRISNLPDICCA